MRPSCLAAAAALALSAVLPSAAPAQDGGIRTTVYPARDTAAYGYVEEFFQRSNLLGAVAWETETRMRLPGWLHLAAAECGHGGTAYSKEQGLVLVCYEMADSLFRAARAGGGTQAQQSRAVSFTLTWAVFHRLAYPLIDWFGIRERDGKELVNPDRRVEDRLADVFAIGSLNDARPDGPLERHLRAVHAGDAAAVRLLAPAAAAVGLPGNATPPSRIRELTCGVYTLYPHGSAALDPLVPEAEREACRSQNARLYATYYGFLFAHKLEGSTRPPADYKADFAGPWRFPPAGRPRVAPGAPAAARTPEGAWSITERLGRAGRPPACTSTGTVTFSAGDERPTATFAGLDACLELFPGEEDETKGGTSAIYASGPAVHFLVGGCAYSGAPGQTPAELRGTLRCDAGEDFKGQVRSYRGIWSAVNATWTMDGSGEAGRGTRPEPPARGENPRFARFDENQSGELRGREIERCGCASHDANGDDSITPDELARPAPAVSRVYRLAQVAGRPLPFEAPDGSGEVLAGRLTLYAPGNATLSYTGREPGGPDTTIVESGRWRISGDTLFLAMDCCWQAARMTGSEFRIRKSEGDPWLLWRREAAAPARPRRPRNR